jgi:hypothetical protein
MKRLTVCLVAVVFAAGCGSSGGTASAPKSTPVASTGSGQSQAAVAAGGRVTPASLCAAEGKGVPRRQCVAGLSRLGKGQVANPAAACRALSKKKTKGVRGRSPRAVCVTAAARLMAAQHAAAGGTGSAAAGPSDTGPSDTSTDDSASADASSGLTCEDANGNPVAPDDPNVEDCIDNSSSGDSGDSGDTSTDDSGP